MISFLTGIIIFERAYAVLLQGVHHDLQILVVHLQGIHLVEIQENLLAALVLPLLQPVHLVRQAILFQQVYLFLVQKLV